MWFCFREIIWHKHTTANQRTACRGPMRSQTSRDIIRVEPGEVSSQLEGFPLSPRGTSLGIGLLTGSITLAPPTFICSRGGGARTPPVVFPLAGPGSGLLWVVCVWSLSPASSVSGVTVSSESESSCRSQGLWGGSSSCCLAVTVCWLRKTISLRREVKLSLSRSLLVSSGTRGPATVTSASRPALSPGHGEDDGPWEDSGVASVWDIGWSWSLIWSEETSDPAETTRGGGGGGGGWPAGTCCSWGCCCCCCVVRGWTSCSRLFSSVNNKKTKNELQ